MHVCGRLDSRGGQFHDDVLWGGVVKRFLFRSNCVMCLLLEKIGRSWCLMGWTIEVGTMTLLASKSTPWVIPGADGRLRGLVDNTANIDQVDVQSDLATCTVADISILGPAVVFFLVGGELNERLILTLTMTDSFVISSTTRSPSRWWQRSNMSLFDTQPAWRILLVLFVGGGVASFLVAYAMVGLLFMWR
jgi:hypothetical protein